MGQGGGDHPLVGEIGVGHAQDVVRRDGVVGPIDGVQRARIAGRGHHRHDRVGDGLGIVQACGKTILQRTADRSQTGRIGRGRPHGGQFLLDGLAHIGDVGLVLDLGQDTDQARVQAVGEVASQGLELLLGHHQPLIQRRGRGKGIGAENVQSLHVTGGRIGCGRIGPRAAEGDADPGQGLAVPRHVSIQRAIGRGLGRDRRQLGARLPVAPVFLDQGKGRVRLHVAGDDDGGIGRAVIAIEELAAVVELVRHRLDVGDEAHGRVFVGVGREGGVALDLEQFGDRVGDVLVVLA